MNCPQKILHSVRPGDTFYCLAQYYRTTVPEIMALNPNANPYNLQIGSTLTICPGEGFTTPAAEADPTRMIELINRMRLVWTQQVYWIRMLIVSIASQLGDTNVVTVRLFQIPKAIANIFSGYYPEEAVDAIVWLFTGQMQIGAALFQALRVGNTGEATQLNRQWYANADQIAETLSSMNPYYNRNEVKHMLYRILQLTTQLAVMRNAGNYMADVDTFNRIEQETLLFADYLVNGLLQQFPEHFRSGVFREEIG